MTPAATSSPSTSHLRELDGVRGLAILLVLAFHTFRAPLGWSGVDLFFVLSGYLIGGILLDNHNAANYYRVFFARRALRILPLYALWTAAYILLEYFLAPQPGTPRYDNLGDILPPSSYLTFTQNVAVATHQTYGAQWMGPTWSLAVEEQFYLLLPVVVRNLSRASLGKAAIAAVILAPLLRIAATSLSPQAPLLLLPCRLDAFAWGILICLACRQRHLRATHFIRRRAPLALAISLPILAAYLTFGEFPAPWNNTIMPAVMALLWATLLATVLFLKPPVISWLRTGPLPQLGTITYGVYILHQGLNHLLHDAILNARPATNTPAGLTVTLATLLLTGLLATASWRYFEQPLTNWGRRTFRYAASQPRRAPAASLVETTG